MVIEIKNLSFRYDSLEALSEISMKGEKGRIISILGPNGAGKTTLLKCISRLISVNDNSIFIDQKDVNIYKRMELARKISYLPQIIFSTHMSVYDSILMGRRPYIDWTLSKEDLEIVSNVIISLNLENIAMRYIDELSGGERQKVFIARVIAQQPEIILLDEPINNLDIANQWKFMNLIVELARTRNICTILTLHDINTAIQFSDELIFLKDGKIVKISDPLKIDTETIKKVYDIDVEIVMHEDLPFIIPVQKTIKPKQNLIND